MKIVNFQGSRMPENSSSRESALTKAPEVLKCVASLSQEKREKIAQTFLDLVGAHLRTANTREAYIAAWKKFFKFCSEQNLGLDQVKPVHFKLWEDWHGGSVATQRQHLAAIRLLYDHLLIDGIVTSNPAARKKLKPLRRDSAHTPVFEHEEIQKFLSSIELNSLIDFRDYALFSTLSYSWARISATLALRVEDYFERKGGRWIRLAEKGGKVHEVPVHTKAKTAIDQWLSASGLGSTPSAPLFPAFASKEKINRNKKTGNMRRMTRRHVWKLVQKRAKAAEIKKRVSSHTFRATGITEYMNAGGSLDIAQRIAGHAQLSTTKIYDRSKDRVTIAEIERVSYDAP